MIKYLKNLEIFFDSDRDKKKYISIVQFAFLISAIFELGGIFLLGPLIFIATSGADSLSNQYVFLAYNLIGKDFDDKSSLNGFTIEISTKKYKGFKTTKFDY